jgi:hydrogenase maturation protease
VAGIGNELMTDDGVGVHAVRLLHQAPPPQTTLLEVGTDFLSAVSFLEQHPRVLVIDAMDAGQPPGTICVCPAEALAQPRPRTSMHELSLLSVLEFIDPQRRPEIRFLGVQPARIELGMGLSAELQEALPRVAAAVGKILAAWK